MRIWLLGALALFLLSGCTDPADGDESRDDVDKVKETVDKALTDTLPQVAGAVGGTYPSIRGQFIGCGVGDDTLQYVVRGELHAPVGDDRAAMERLRGVFDEAGFATTLEDDDLDLEAERDGVEVAFTVYPPREGAPTSIKPFRFETGCVSYDADVADYARGLGVDEYDELSTTS